MRNNKKVSKITLWYTRTFKVISSERATKLGLFWYRNVFGDEINHLGCRSIWVYDIIAKFNSFKNWALKECNKIAE